MANNNYIDTFKPFFEIQYKDKTERELVNAYHQAVDAMPMYPKTPAEKAKYYENLALQEVLKEKIQEIQDARNKSNEAHAQFKEARKELKRECISNLRTAASANGQLVAAILEEEDGLTSEQIGSWCEELETLDEDALKALIYGLCKEGIIERDKEGKFHLLFIMDEDLKAYPATDWALKKLEYDKLDEKSRYLLDLFWLTDSGYTYHDMENGQWDRKALLLADQMIDRVTNKPYSSKAKDLTKALMTFRMLKLKSKFIGEYRSKAGPTVFYYPLLGKKEV